MVNVQFKEHSHYAAYYDDAVVGIQDVYTKFSLFFQEDLEIWIVI